jgi:predicted ATPase
MQAAALCSRFRIRPAPFVQDKARVEDRETRQRLDRWLEEDYRALGYKPVRIPAMPVADRERFVLASIQSSSAAKLVRQPGAL